MSLTIKTISSTDKFHAFEKTWKEFEKKTEHTNVTVSFDHLKVWWDTFKNVDDNGYGHDKKLLILLLYRDNELIAIAPFVKLYRLKKKIIKVHYIEFLGQQWGATYCDIIGKDLKKEEIDFIIKWLYDNEKFDLISLKYIPENSKNFNFQSENLTVLCGCFEIKLGKDYDDARSLNYSRNMKNEVNKSYNRIIKANLDILTDFEDEYCFKYYDKCKQVSLSKLLNSNLHSLYNNKYKRSFVKDMFYKKSSNYCSLLKLQDQMISYNIGRVFNDNVFAFDAAFDRSYVNDHKIGLGNLAYDLIIRKYAGKYKTLCMGVGIDFYKFRFTKNLVKIYTSLQKGNTLKSGLFYSKELVQNKSVEKQFMDDLNSKLNK